MKRFAVTASVLAMAVVIGCGTSSESNSAQGKQEDKLINIVGQYTYRQTLPGGGAETGTVEVQMHGDTYKVVWTRADKNTYYGVGIRTNDLLSVCYSYPGAGERGVLVYKITPGPKLDGHWTTLGGDGKLYPDTWTLIK